ncbi:shikimate kinase [Arcanobacterium haemolyticum]|nr:shikimate kinase [Arcanobacterium haemolyticum]
MSVRGVFVGMPGSGKTTVGRAVALSLDVPFRDSDALIEETTGRTIPDIFAEDGEQEFRRIEAEVIATALVEFDGILSLGGGAVLTESTRRILRDHPVILIDVEHDELLRRVSRSHTVRPLLATDPSAKLAELKRDREPFYREVARHTVSSDDGPVERVVAAVLTVLGYAEIPVVLPAKKSHGSGERR